MLNTKTNAPKTSVIIFGDQVTCMGVIRGLRDIKINIYIISEDGNGVAINSKYVKDSIILDSKSQNYVEKIISWISVNFTVKPLLMIAGNDDALIALSKKYDLLCNVAVPTFPSWNIVKSVINKELMHEFAKNKKIPTIKTQRINSILELENYLQNKHDLRFPLFLKSTFSRQFSKKFKTKGVICHSKSEVFNAYERYDGFLDALLLQEFIPGNIDEISAVLLVLNKNSKVIGVCANNKLRSSHLYGPTTLSSSMWDKKMIEHSIVLAESIGYQGFVGVQFKFDSRDKTYKFLEINGRFSTSVSLAQKCGINMPKLIYDEFNGIDHERLSVIEQTYKNNILLWMPVSDIKLLFQKRFYKRPLHYLSSLIGRGYVIEPYKLNDIKPILSLFKKIKIFKK